MVFETPKKYYSTLIMDPCLRRDDSVSLVILVPTKSGGIHFQERMLITTQSLNRVIL